MKNNDSSWDSMGACGLPMVGSSSLFPNDEGTYEQRVREIEEYYVRTLLDESTDDENVEVAPEQLEQELSNSETSSTTSSLSRSHLSTDFPLNGKSIFTNDFQLEPTDLSGMELGWQTKAEDFEVKISSDYCSTNNPLPLTTKNLERLSLSMKNTKRLPYGQRILIKKTTKTGNTNNTNSEGNHEEVNRGLYKTELCESFSTRGICRYGSKCQFAHGLSELKFRQFGNNFRTKPCINWTKLGYCPYGKRCCFKHGSDQDIKVYLKAGTYLSNSEKGPKNLHANVKALQKITW